MVAGLCVLLLREASALLAAWVQARRSRAAVWSLTDQCLPGVLLCAILTVLISTMLVFAVSENPWAHAASEALGERPVYTLRYAEWSATVPLLLTLAGRCALRRPAGEVLPPLLATEAYMFLAWAALLVNNTLVRWALVLGTFAGYGWASVGMFRWTAAFLREEPREAGCRRLRASAAASLVALFGLYGVIYLLALFGLIGTHVEQIAYTTSGFATKVLMSLLFTVIRGMEHHQALGDMLCKISSMSTAFMSLLRGSFDFVVPCLANDEGECTFPAVHAGDTAELEGRLGATLLGSSLNQLLAGPSEKERFARYVRNVARQAPLAGGGPRQALEAGAGAPPPVAQVLHVKLLRAPRAGAPTEGRPGEEEVVSAVVHLSAALPLPGAPAGTLQLVAGLCLAPGPEPPAGAAAAAAPTAPGVAEGSDEEEEASAERETPSTSAESSGVQPPLASSGHSVDDGVFSDAETGSEIEAVEARKGTRRQLLVSLLNHKMKKGLRRQKRQRRLGCAHGGGRDLCGSLRSAASSESGQTVLGGSDVNSQSSKLSYVGSVTMACRQLLGPLHDHLPPKQLVSKRIEDHVACAAEMVRLTAPAEAARFQRERELGDWRLRARGHALHAVLSRGTAPGCGVSEDVWRSHLLPNLEEPPPGRRPEVPDPPEEPELWLKAWRRTYEDWNSEDASSAED